MNKWIVCWIMLMPGMLAAQDGAIGEDQRLWEKYTYFDAGFELKSPGELIERIDMVETDLGTLEFHRMFYQTADESASDNLIYQLSWVQYPEDLFPPDSTDLIEAFFQETIAEATKTVRGYLAYSSAISLQGYPGYIWRINYLEDKAVIKTKAYLRKGKYISLSTVSYQGRNLNSSTDRFLNSFRFLE